MRNIKLVMEYDGTNYAGWQSQNRRRPQAAGRRLGTIQETIEKTLQQILQEKIKLIASGRTDAGVHARDQAANFNTNSNISLERLQRALNGLLPQDIAVNRIEEADLDFHSRFSAKAKTYRYTILNRKYRSALLRNNVYFYPHLLDLNLMQKEAREILGKHDFKAFQAADKKARNPVKTIKKIKISKTGDLIYIDIEADGFLYNMVRNIVGTLIEIGRGKFPKGSLKKILLSKNRKMAGPTAPARGLCLVKIKY
jgi:tRNA pseudouridine38-40 synthase